MAGNASSGLGSADHHSLRDMRSMGADDRPTDRDEDTNRKSLFPATKTLHSNIKLQLTQTWPGPPRFQQSNPRVVWQQRAGKVLVNVVIKDSQSGVVRQTSIDCCKPTNFLFVNLVTCRVDLKRVVAACVCNIFVCSERKITVNRHRRLYK